LNYKINVACVILAAGLSKRFGGPKQLAKLEENGTSLVQNALDTANASSSDYVILVLGQAASEVAAETALGRASLVYNLDFAMGLSSSVKCGLSNVPADSDAVLFMVADQPYLTSGILDDVMRIYRSNRSKIVALSSPSGEPRNPVLFDRRMFTELGQLSGDKGAREIVLNHIKEVKFLRSNDPRVLLDIDTKEALEAARRKKM